jgi:myo-inositol-1(or 4)-monophosphatase
MPSEIQDLLQLGLRATELAKTEVLKHFGHQITVDWKPDHTPVTIADRNAEQVVRNFFAQETPDFGFVGEEFGRTSSQAEYQWILDPIDGTKSFVRGVPLFGSILALYRKNQPILGIIGLPALGSVLHASLGGGAWVDGQAAHVSNVKSMENATVLSGTVNTMEDKGYGEGFAKLRHSAQLYRGWGDCYGYYLVACGRAEIMADPVVSIWDIAAMPIILAEAGGSFSELSGNTRFLDEAGTVLAGPEGFTGLASNGHLHSRALEAFQRTL